MKKIFTLIFVVFTTIVSTNFVKADTNNEENDLLLVSSETTYEADGSYIVSNVYKSSISSYGNVYTTHGNKDVTKYSASDDVLWVYTLTAYYTVNTGVSAICFDASYTYNISGSGWSFSNGSTYYDENYATGKGKFTHKLLFVTTQTVNIDITLTCDEYGNLS